MRGNKSRLGLAVRSLLRPLPEWFLWMVGRERAYGYLGNKGRRWTEEKTEARIAGLKVRKRRKVQSQDITFIFTRTT